MARTHGGDLSREESRGIQQVTSVGQHEVALPVALRISLGAFGEAAVLGQWLKIVRHRIARRGIVVPAFVRLHPAQFFGDESMCKRNAGIEAPVVTDLEHQTTSIHSLAERRGLFNRDAKWLFDQHVLAGGQSLQAERNMKLIGDTDEYRLHAGVGQHNVEVAEHLFRLMRSGGVFEQIRRQIADGIKLCVSSFLAGFEMRGLGNRASSQYGNLQQVWFFCHKGGPKDCGVASSAPQCNPAPKAANISGPAAGEGCCWLHSAAAIRSDAEEVLPYRWMLRKKRSSGTASACATRVIRLRLA